MTRRNAICVMVGALLLISVSHVRAATVTEIEPNDTFATAQNVDAFFSLESNPSITSSTTIPHASVHSPTNRNTGTNFDVYSFTVNAANSQGIFDIDGLLDSNGNLLQQNDEDYLIELFNASGIELAQDDDVADNPGGTDPGSGGFFFDPFLTFTFTTPGTYFIRVGRFSGQNIGPPESDNGITELLAGDYYTLHLSVESAVVAVPEPTSLALLSVGMVTFAGGAAVRRRRKKNQANEATACS